MADIDLSGYTGTEFNVIGTEVVIETIRPGRPGEETVVVEQVLVPFTGTFGGNGYCISNFTYTCWGTGEIALFGTVADPNARISDLELIDPHVYARDGQHVGALVGYLASGTVANCHISNGLVNGSHIVARPVISAQ